MMKNKRYAFTMIEVVFVIVILGILAAVAIPKFAVTRTDAQVTKGKSDISTIRSAIMTERQSRLIKGDSAWIPQLSDNNGTLFSGSDNNHTLLMYGINSGTGEGYWKRTSVNHYTYKVGGQNCKFLYDGSGKFILDPAMNPIPAICNRLVK